MSCLSDQEIDARMARDGFPEMRLLWNRFRRRGIAVASLAEEALVARRRRHMGARLWPLVPGLATGAAVAWLSPLEAPGAAFLAWYAAVCIARYATLQPLMERDLAFQLSRPDYRAWFEAQERTRRARERLAQLGVNRTWDDPSYRHPPLPSHHAFVQDALREVLGTKEERRHKPGRFSGSLRDGKGSVTRFVARFGERIAANREGHLAPGEATGLLRELLVELVPGTPGHGHVTEALAGAEVGHYLSGGEVRAEVWKRDPWVDLTHQEEFHSSASLRGVKWVGRGPKGRIGTFGYLRNPAVSALDFRTRAGRVVRARLGAAEADGRPVLFVDGVEGSNAVAPDVVLGALRAYAEAAGFHAVVCNGYVHNVVPARFVAKVGGPWREVRLNYVDDAEREYLDAFAAPVEPFEYARPKGTVVGPVLGAPIGRPVRFRTRVLAGARLFALWLLLVPVLLATLVSVWLKEPALFAAIAAFLALGGVAHILFQRRGLTSGHVLRPREGARGPAASPRA